MSYYLLWNWSFSVDLTKDIFRRKYLSCTILMSTISLFEYLKYLLTENYIMRVKCRLFCLRFTEQVPICDQ